MTKTTYPRTVYRYVTGRWGRTVTPRLYTKELLGETEKTYKVGKRVSGRGWILRSDVDQYRATEAEARKDAVASLRERAETLRADAVERDGHADELEAREVTDG